MESDDSSPASGDDYTLQDNFVPATPTPAARRSTTSSSSINLSLRTDESCAVPYHVNGSGKVYIYRPAYQATSRERKAFDELAQETNCGILWGSAKRRTPIWNKFIEGLDVQRPHKPKAVCLACGAIVIHPQASRLSKSNLSSLKIHLQKCPRQLSGERNSSNEFNEDNVVTHSSDTMYSPAALQEVIFDMVITENLPFSLVDSPHFRRFCRIVRRSDDDRQLDKDIGNRKALSDRVRSTATRERENLKHLLAENKSRFSLSLDIWTSPNHFPYIGIMVHFINNEYCLQREVLAFDLIEGEHTGHSLSEFVWETLESFRILDKV